MDTLAALLIEAKRKKPTTTTAKKATARRKKKRPPDRVVVLTAQMMIDAMMARMPFRLAPHITNLVVHSNKRLNGKPIRLLADALRHNDTLTVLYLHIRMLRYGDVKVLADVLATNTTLRQLNLSDTNIDSRGASDLATALTQNTTLQKLNLSYNTIDGEGMEDIAQALTRDNKTLTRLNLGANVDSDQGIQAVSDMLAANQTLVRLELSSLHLDTAMVNSLATALARNPALSELDLSFNDLGDGAAAVLAAALVTNTNLHWLDLGVNAIGDAGAAALADVLRTPSSGLADLSLYGNRITVVGARALAEALTRNVALRRLSLSRNGDITDEGVAAISGSLGTNTTLRTLDLAMISMSDSGVDALVDALFVDRDHGRQVPWRLELGDNQIGPKGALRLVDALGHNTPLEVLNLRFNPIGTLGAAAIAAVLAINTTLRALALEGADVDDTVMAALSSALQQRTAPLTYLDLATNPFRVDGVRALAEALAANAPVIELDLTQNDIDDEGVVAIAAALEQNHTLQTLTMEDNPDLGDPSAVALARMLAVNTTLRHLDLRESGMTWAGVQSLEQALHTNQTLEFLGVSNGDVDPDDVDSLRTRLAERVVADQAALRAAKQLILLAHAHDPQSPFYQLPLEMIVDILRRYKARTLLTVEAQLPGFRANTTAISGEGWTDTAEDPKSSDRQQQQHGMDALLAIEAKRKRVTTPPRGQGPSPPREEPDPKRPRPTEPELEPEETETQSGEGGGGDVVAVVNDSHSLNEALWWANRPIRLGPRLESFALEPYVALTRERAELLADALRENTTLAWLRLPKANADLRPISGTVRFAGPIEYLFEALHHNRGLTALDLEGTDWVERVGGGGGLAALLWHNSTLADLRLAKMGLSDTNAARVLESLREHNHTLRHLDLSHNSLTEIIWSAIGRCLATNSGLRSLSLANNELINQGGSDRRMFEQGLAANQTLVSLDLGSTHIRDRQLRSLATALRDNQSLTELNLHGSRAHKGGVAALADLLAENLHPALTWLNLNFAFAMDQSAYEAVGRMVRSNTSLTYLALSGALSGAGAYSYGVSGALMALESVTQAMRHNHTLTYLDLSRNRFLYDEDLDSAALPDHDSEAEDSDAEDEAHQTAILDMQSAITMDLAAALADKDCVLRTLLLQDCVMEFAGVQTVLGGVRHNTTLRHLDLTYNMTPFPVPSDAEDDAVTLWADDLSTNQTLQRLAFGKNHVDDEHAFLFARILAANRSLTDLDLSHNDITDAGAAGLADALTQPGATLRRLDLRWNLLKADTGTMAFGAALFTNRSLVELDLRHNHIDAEAARDLIQALEGNSTLRVLGVSSSWIDLPAFQRLVQQASAPSDRARIYLAAAHLLMGTWARRPGSAPARLPAELWHLILRRVKEEEHVRTRPLTIQHRVHFSAPQPQPEGKANAV